MHVETTNSLEALSLSKPKGGGPHVLCGRGLRIQCGRFRVRVGLEENRLTWSRSAEVVGRWQSAATHNAAAEGRGLFPVEKSVRSRCWSRLRRACVSSRTYLASTTSGGSSSRSGRPPDELTRESVGNGRGERCRRLAGLGGEDDTGQRYVRRRGSRGGLGKRECDAGGSTALSWLECGRVKRMQDGPMGANWGWGSEGGTSRGGSGDR